MKKTKLKNYFKTGILYFGIPFLLWNCESENLNTGQQSMIETVSVYEAIDFFTVKTASKSAKSVKEAYVIPNLTQVSQEEIINSDALLIVIPATTIYEAHYSRILLLKINDEIQSLVFSMYASDTNTQYFTGEIVITDLQGSFLNGYRVANGQFISQFRKKEENGNTAAKTGNAVCPAHGECTAESDCILCLQELDEVTVEAEGSGSGEYIDIYVGLNDFPGMDEGGANGPDTGMAWDYGPGDGMAPEDENDTNTEEDLVEETPPSCESFIYSQIGATDWQCAAITGVHDLFTVFNWECIGYDWGIFHQPLYFQLPVNGTFPLASGLTATNSAAFLHEAFKAFDTWYQNNACATSHAAMEQQLLEYIKDEFEEQGGNVTLTPPMGFTGEPTPYKTSWSGYGNCN